MVHHRTASPERRITERRITGPHHRTAASPERRFTGTPHHRNAASPNAASPERRIICQSPQCARNSVFV